MRILILCRGIVIALALILSLAAFAGSSPVDQATEVDSIVLASDAAIDRVEQDAEAAQRLASYSRIRNVWRFVSFATHVLILGFLAFSGLAARLRDWTRKVGPKFLALWTFTTLLITANYLLYLPFAIYRGFVVESDFGFLNLSFFGWWGDSLLGLLVKIGVAIVPVWLLYQCLERFRRWWLAFTSLLAPVIVFAIVLTPVIISPLFNDFIPLQDKQIESAVQLLAERAGIGDADIFEVNASRQSSRVNAYVTGLFGSKRIVLYDTLLEEFTLDEIRFIMAHEIGHYVKHHVWWGTLVAIVYLGLLFWLLSHWGPLIIGRWSGRLHFAHLSNWASLPLIIMMLTILNFALQPLTNMVSRVMERQSDEYGLDLSGVPTATAISTYHKLSGLNLSDPSPHPLIEFWFYTHPSLSKRIAFAEKHRSN